MKIFSRFHLMYQNLSIYQMIYSFRYLFQNKNQILYNLFQNYNFGNVDIKYFNSGRNALAFILELVTKNKKEKKYNILVPSFTCEVVPIQILRKKIIPIYYDLCPTSKNYFLSIKNKINSRTIGIIYQHSFGKHDDIGKLYKYCKKKKIYLIEDKALCFLSKKKKLPELQADFAYYSFENSKTISTRMGGMLICRKKSFNLNVNYKNNVFINFFSDLRTIFSIVSYNIKGDFGFFIRKILIFLKVLEASIDKKDININRKNKFYDLTSFQKNLLIFQLFNIKKKNIFICNQNISFWKKLLPDLKIENSKNYNFFYPVRILYNGKYFKEVKKLMIDHGLKQDDWFEGGIGSKSFNHKLIKYNLKNYKQTKKFCDKYTNLPSLIYLNDSFKNKLLMNLKK